MTTQLNTAFAIKTKNVVTFPNNDAPQPISALSVVNIGAGGTTGAGTDIPAQSITSGYIRVAPAADTLQHYVLPQATNLLRLWGQNQTNYASRVATGDITPLKIINTGAFPAFVKGNATGSDGSAIIASTGSLGSLTTGTGGLAHTTQAYLLWTNVASSASGVTGTYTVFI